MSGKYGPVVRIRENSVNAITTLLRTRLIPFLASGDRRCESRECLGYGPLLGIRDKSIVVRCRCLALTQDAEGDEVAGRRRGSNLALVNPRVALLHPAHQQHPVTRGRLVEGLRGGEARRVSRKEGLWAGGE